MITYKRCLGGPSDLGGWFSSLGLICDAKLKALDSRWLPSSASHAHKD
jgi:hypothetical protein